jgi:AcrR family transcriptional regulator
MLEAAGLSKGAFYYYFDDKADLAIACFQDVFGPMVEMSLPPDPKDVTDFWEAVRVMSYRMLDYVESSTEKFELVSKLAAALAREPELSKRLTPLVSEVTQRMMKLWMRGQELGAVRTDIPLPAQMSVLQGIKEGLSRVMTPRDSTLTPEELHHIVELQLDLFQRVCSPAPVSRP